MKKITMSNNKKTDIKIVDSINDDIISIKDIKNAKEKFGFKRFTLQCVIKKIKVKHHDNYAVIKVRIKDNTASKTVIMIKHDDYNDILSKLIIGKQYKLACSKIKVFSNIGFIFVDRIEI